LDYDPNARSQVSSTLSDGLEQPNIQHAATINFMSYQYKFGEFLLDPARRVLLRNDAPVPLTPKAFDTLWVLVRENGRVVEKEELLKEIWPDTFVGEATLAQNVFTLRKALGQKDGPNQFIETVPRHGYRFTADVTTVIAEPDEIVEVSNISSSESRKRIRLVAALAATSIACALIAFSAVKFRQRKSPAAALLSGPLQVKRLTNNGRVVRATLSQDRRYVAYATQENEKQTLWLKQVEATTDVQIVSAVDVFYRGIVFARDLTSIFYVRYEANEVLGKLYQMPLLGGTPKLILSDIDSSLSFSPDGKRFAFFRNDPQSRKTTLLTANADGSDQQELSTYSGVFVSDGPAWSPDGKEILFPLAIGGDPNRNNRTVLISRQVDDGLEKPFTPQGWNGISGVEWLDDGNVVIVGWSETDTLATQVWELSREDGHARRITNDLNSYAGVSLSSVTGALVTVQADRVANFWLADATDFSKAKQITSGFGDRGGEFLGISWTSPDKVVYGSTAGDGVDIWTMDLDGSNRKQLTVDPLMDIKPAVSPVDGSIVFVSRRTGAPHLWTISAAGLNPRQLTNGKTESYPSLSPDGKWVAYISIDDIPTLWKLSLDGTQPKQLTNNFTWVPSVSPDGKLIACLYKQNPAQPFRLALIPAEGGAPVKVFSLPPMVLAVAGLRWAPDGSAVVYINNERDVSNLWSQPIDGKPPKQLTRFDSSQIFRFAWSPNGKQVILERGSDFRDAVLITSSTQTSS
jgi:eukaryotic-like serine/threonine-protein kinase